MKDMGKVMPPELVSLSDGPNVLLDKPIVLLGRHHECDIQLNSRKVSRRHCCLAQVQDYLVVRDLSSTNGIQINGKRVHSGQLNPGDELTIGNFVYRIQWIGHPSQPLPEGQIVSDDSSPSPAKLVGTDGPAELESYDEPVPLADGTEGNTPEPDDSAQDSDKKKSNDHSGSNKSNMVDQPASIILPDSLDLAPMSNNDISKND